jgi:hypothetical protein
VQSASAQRGVNGRMPYLLKRAPRGVYLYSIESGKRRIHSGLIRNLE